MKVRKELAQIASPRRVSKVLNLPYGYTRQILSGEEHKKYNLTIVNDLISQIETFLKRLRQAKKEMSDN